MFHCMINFSLITFICYAVAAPAKAIVGGSKAKKPRRAPVNTHKRTHPRRTRPARMCGFTEALTAPYSAPLISCAAYVARSPRRDKRAHRRHESAVPVAHRSSAHLLSSVRSVNITLQQGKRFCSEHISIKTGQARCLPCCLSAVLNSSLTNPIKRFCECRHTSLRLPAFPPA